MFMFVVMNVSVNDRVVLLLLLLLFSLLLVVMVMVYSVAVHNANGYY